MPIYDFENTKTGEIFEDMMKIADKEKYLKKNPHIKQVIGGKVNIARNLNVRRIDSGFRDVLKKVKAAHPRGNINI